MSDTLNKMTVLVLNKFWQAINVRSPQLAFGQMAADVATALDIDGENLRPVTWEQWLKLPVREGDNFVRTQHLNIRIPTVIICVNYGEVHMRRPAFSPRALRERDKGVCQYTGRKLAPGEGNIDHVLPRSRGGKTDWTNCVLASKEINTLKADRLPHEAGLKLQRVPRAPTAVPPMNLIRNPHGIKDWDLILKHKD